MSEGLEACGTLFAWEGSASEFGPFYEESHVVVDIILEETRLPAFTGSLKTLCDNHGVSLDEWPPAAPRPHPFLQGPVRRSLHWIRTWLIGSAQDGVRG